MSAPAFHLAARSRPPGLHCFPPLRPAPCVLMRGLDPDMWAGLRAEVPGAICWGRRPGPATQREPGVEAPPLTSPHRSVGVSGARGSDVLAPNTQFSCCSEDAGPGVGQGCVARGPLPAASPIPFLSNQVPKGAPLYVRCLGYLLFVLVFFFNIFFY